jgi:hypothetical protein
VVHADDINILGGSVLNVQGIVEALVVDSEEIGLEVNVDKTKYMACLEIRIKLKSQYKD